MQIAGSIRRRYRAGVVGSVLTLTLVAVAVAGSTGASGAPTPKLDRKAVAQHILQTRAASLMTSPAQAALRMVANGDRQLAPAPAKPVAVTPASGGTAPASPGFTNVRVNNPALDTHQPDQTTQSETTIAVAGSNVVVGYNDSQQSGLFLTAGASLTGYAYSTDRGASFTDAGALPNAGDFVNVGDPWLATDRAGNVYYGNLAFDALNYNLDIAVAKSTDGGKTFGAPVSTFRPPYEIFYIGDKDAVATGPDPTVKTRDNVYAVWDDLALNFNTGEFSTGLPVARSTDGGRSWQITYADKSSLDMLGCSFQQYIGAVPLADKSDGTLYVTAEKLAVDDPDCTGQSPIARSEVIFRSTDGGVTFGPGVTISGVTESVPDGLLFLGPGRYMRNLEFPTVTQRGDTLFAAWNDGANGKSHIRLAASTDAGQTWNVSFATQGNGDELQPALSADNTGIHLLYYQRNTDNTLDVLVGNSQNGSSFSTKRVTTTSFRGTLTVPQFDPLIAFGYMGDYIANVSDGTRQYFAWGDNRNTVRGFLYPDGREDPDVYFAVQ
jgi:hypothetical protein